MYVPKCKIQEDEQSVCYEFLYQLHCSMMASTFYNASQSRYDYIVEDIRDAKYEQLPTHQRILTDAQ